MRPRQISGVAGYSIRNRGLLGGARGYTFVNSEAALVVAAFTAPPTNARKALIDNLVGSLKASGAWAIADLLNVLAAADSQAARTNWKNPGTFTLTAVGSPTFTADRGYTGDGSGAYLDTNCLASQLVNSVQNSCTAMCWTGNDVNSSIGEFCNGNNDYSIQSNNGGQLIARAQASTGSPFGIATGVGLNAFTRAGTSVGAVYKNGVNLGAIATTSTTPSGAGSIKLLRGAATFGTRRMSVFMNGAALSDAQHAAAYTAFQTYLTAIGAA